MLSQDEQRVLEDIERFWAETAEEPVHAVPLEDDAPLPFAIIAGVWLSVTLVLLGLVLAGLSLAAATAAGYAWWNGRTRSGRGDGS